MKFIIARNTASAIYNAANELELYNGTLPSNEAINANDKLANVSVRGEGADIVIEVSDVIVLRYLALYAKTYKLIVPMVTAVIGMWNAVQSLIETDCEELIAFITKRKE